ncbi:MAG: F0F1 ATP synthase subunit epsilon, partial [Anaerolineae bacterium]
MAKLLLDIVTAERLVYSDEVDMVTAPGIEGELGILPRHTPLMTALQVGELRIRKGDQVEHFAIGGGFMEVRPDRVVVLADTAERADEIDVERAEAARQRAEKLLAEGPPREDLSRLEGALRRSRIRLKVAGRRRRRPRPEAPSGEGPG